MVSLIWRQSQRRDHGSLTLAWSIFIVGEMVSYSFSETGKRQAHGNFGWCGAISVLILWVECGAVFIQQVARPLVSSLDGFQALLWRVAVCTAVLACHVLSGLEWYALYATTYDGWKWY
jgi:hypothetical protein